MAIAPRAEDIVRIEAIELPEQKEKGEGIYEWRHMSTRFILDILDLEKELKAIMPGREAGLLDRIQNFRKLYINLKTGEVST